MLPVTFVLFGRNQLYVTDSLPVALHVKVNVRPSVNVLFAGARVITGVSRSKVESSQVPIYIRSISILLNKIAAKITGDLAVKSNLSVRRALEAGKLHS